MKGSKMFSFITEEEIINPYHKLPSLELLKTLYYVNQLSAGEIAKKYGSSVNAVTLRFKRAGLSLRSLSEARELLANHVELTKNLTELLDGLLLGDGSVIGFYEKSGCYAHTDKHGEYIFWLKDELEGQGITSVISYPRGYPLLHSLNYRELFSVRQRWYPAGIKQVPLDLSLSSVVLRHWYIGDGSFRHGKNHTKKAERLLIAIFFDDKGKSLLSGKLHELGIGNTIIPEGIYIRAEARQKFFQYILSDDPQIPRCYLYKFPEEYCHD